MLKKILGATDLKRSIKFLSVSVVLIRLSQLTSHSGAKYVPIRERLRCRKTIISLCTFRLSRNFTTRSRL